MLSSSVDWALRGATVALVLLIAAALLRDYGRLVAARRRGRGPAPPATLRGRGIVSLYRPQRRGPTLRCAAIASRRRKPRRSRRPARHREHRRLVPAARCPHPVALLAHGRRVAAERGT